MLRRNDWRLSIIYACSVGLILFVSAFNFFSFRDMNASTERMTSEKYPLSHTVNQLLLAAVNQETGIRGYLSAGDSVFLEPYEQGSADVRYYSKELTDAGIHEPGYRLPVSAVLERLKELQAFFVEEIRLVEEGRAQQAEARLAEGKAIMDGFRSRIAVLEQAVLDSMEEEWGKQRSRANYSMEMIVAAIVVSLLAVFVTGIMYRTTRVALRSTLESERRYRRLVDSSPDAIAVHQGGTVAFANPACAKLMGAAHSSELIGMPIMRFVPKEFAPLVAQRADNAMNDNEVGAMDEQFVRLDGQKVDVEVTAIGIPYEGRPAVLIVAREIGLRKEAERKIKQANSLLLSLSKLDGLTGIPNRRSFDEDSRQLWEDASAGINPLSLVFFDVDNFKPYNDHYGHQAGDACLQMIASVVEGEARKAGGTAYRYGGEEFAVLFPDLGLDEAKEASEKIREAVEQCAIPHDGQAPGTVVTISVGVASRTVDDGGDIKEWILAADQALYQAKRLGRNAVAFAKSV